MKPETRNTVLMILRADGTVSQPMMDAIVVAMDGGTLENVVKRSEARSILGVRLPESISRISFHGLAISTKWPSPEGLTA